MFNPQKSYRHSAPRVQAVACVVYDDLPILAAKIGKENEIRKEFAIIFIGSLATRHLQARYPPGSDLLPGTKLGV